MYILKKGTPKTYVFECSECGCVFVANSSEVDGWSSVMGISYPTCFCKCCVKKVVSGTEVTQEEIEAIKKRIEEDGEND